MIMKKLFAIVAVVAGVVASAAGAAAASASHPASAARPAAAQHANAASTSKIGGEDPSHESDGPGGHQDQPGQNINHQFRGTE